LDKVYQIGLLPTCTKPKAQTQSAIQEKLPYMSRLSARFATEITFDNTTTIKATDYGNAKQLTLDDKEKILSGIQMTYAEI
jgi:hypothetical protein